jgi:hypothetical membrane protein
MHKIAFWTALSGVSIFALTVVLGGVAFTGYSHATQYISELGATGAPHGRWVSWLGFLPSGLLLVVFAFTAPMALPRSRWTWLGFFFIAVYAFGLVASAFFPCDFGCRPDNPTVAQVIHNGVGGVSYIAGVTALLILAIQARKWPGGRHLLYLGLVCWLAGALSLPWLAPNFAYVGVAQRILEISMGAWIITCAYYVRATSTRTE